MRQPVAIYAIRVARHVLKHGIANHVAIRRDYQDRGSAQAVASRLPDQPTKVYPAIRILGIVFLTVRRTPDSEGLHAAGHHPGLEVLSGRQGWLAPLLANVLPSQAVYQPSLPSTLRALFAASFVTHNLQA